MIRRETKPRSYQLATPFLLFFVYLAATTGPADAIHITVDYRYDTNNFFNTQQKRDALEAAAARLSTIITSPLLAATLTDNTIDPRIGFQHPGTGVNFEVSAAVNAASDAILSAPGGTPAQEYRGPWSIGANDWILYAGGRSLDPGVAGTGGTGSGRNFDTVFTNNSSHLNRGFRITSNDQNLPVWGGSITFDNDGSTLWNFDLNIPAPSGTVDLYSIALHEIGHALGLSTTFSDWMRSSSGGQFTGLFSVPTYNADNGTSASSLNVTADQHWQDNTYDSFIFQNGSPDYVGTVGNVTKQDLLMEPTQDYTATVRRFELTNVDVAALRDVGWSTLTQISSDFNKDNRVNLADYVTWRKTNNTAQGYYAVWRENFSTSAAPGASLNSSFAASVPEPASWLLLIGSTFWLLRRPERRSGFPA
jgi:hypothetical protein